MNLQCLVGTDVRKLVHDGYPASNVVGCDLRQEFIEYGYKLYRDRDQCAIRFFASDIFEVPYPFPADQAPVGPLDIGKVTEMKQLYGRVDHFYTGALFHLFDESTQYALALRVAQLIKRSPGTIVFGRHQGLEEEGYINDHLSRYMFSPDDIEMALNTSVSRRRYGHSVESWLLLWKKVFSEIESPEFAESKVVVEAEISGSFAPHVFRSHGPTNMLYWSVRII